MPTFVFVYGTLKADFANFSVNAGTRIKGEFETVHRYPLYIIGEYYIPWLIDIEGEGNHIRGQLFNVDAQALKIMDELEMLGEPGWFARRQILVRPQIAEQDDKIDAFVYFGARERLHTDDVHTGPITEFTLSHDSEYRKRAA